MTRILSRSATSILLGAGLVLCPVSLMGTLQPAYAQDRDQTRDQDKLHDATQDKDQTKDQDKLHDATQDKDQTKDQDKLHDADQSRDQDMDTLHDQDLDQTRDRLQTHDRVGPGQPNGPSTGTSTGPKSGAGPH